MSEEKASTNKETVAGTTSRSGRQIVPTNRWRPANHENEDQLLRKSSSTIPKDKAIEKGQEDITKNKSIIPRVLIAEEGSPLDYMIFDSRPKAVVLPKDPVRKVEVEKDLLTSKEKPIEDKEETKEVNIESDKSK